VSNKNVSKKSAKHVLKEVFTNKQVLFSLGITIVLIVIFHVLSTITLPCINGSFSSDSSSFTSMLNLLAGGGLTRMSLFAVGVGPYITAQIIVQLLSSDLIPPLSRAAKQGERGRKKLEILTRILTLPFCLAQGYAIIALIMQSASSSGITVFGVSTLADLSVGNIFVLLFIFAGGTYICIFISDMITKRGVGNGITLLILSGIISSFFSDFNVAFEYIKLLMPSVNYYLTYTISCIIYVIFFIIILFAIIFINNSLRKIPIQQTGQGLITDFNDLPFLPIKVNSAGVIPVIFASSIMTIPGTIAQFLPENNSAKWFIAGTDGSEGYLTLGSWSGMALYFFFIILFTFFYSYVQINPQQLSENFEKSGRFIPGVKSGKVTEKHISRVLSRVNWIGSPFLAVVAILPYIISKTTGIPSGMAIGGTGIIIVVSGTIELWNSILSAAITSSYTETKTKLETKLYESKNLENDTEGEIW